MATLRLTGTTNSADAIPPSPFQPSEARSDQRDAPDAVGGAGLRAVAELKSSARIWGSVSRCRRCSTPGRAAGRSPPGWPRHRQRSRAPPLPRLNRPGEQQLRVRYPSGALGVPSLDDAWSAPGAHSHRDQPVDGAPRGRLPGAAYKPERHVQEVAGNSGSHLVAGPLIAPNCRKTSSRVHPARCFKPLSVSSGRLTNWLSRPWRAQAMRSASLGSESGTAAKRSCRRSP